MVQKFEIDARADKLKDIREFINQLGAEINCSDTELFDIQLVVGEAVINSIEHGSHPGDHVSLKAIWSPEEKEIIIKVKDNGSSFNIDEHNEEVTDLQVYELDERGRGMIIISNLVDNYYFNKEPDGKSITLTKRIK